MGVVLSRLTNSGVEVTCYFLFSLLQFEYRRLCHLSLFCRRRQTTATTTRHPLAGSSADPSIGSRRMVLSESVGTQTCENTTLALNYSPRASSEAGIRKMEGKTSDSLTYTTDVFEMCDDMVTTTKSEMGHNYNRNTQTKHSPSPTRKRKSPPNKGSRRSMPEGNSISTRFIFPDVSIASTTRISTSAITMPKARKVERGLGLGGSLLTRTRNNSAATRTIVTQLVRPTRRHSDEDDYNDHDADVSSDSGSTSSTGCNDIYIYENPDFTRFGDVYRNLASPSDKLSGPTEARCDSGVSSLSPVKEESESDVSSVTDAESCWPAHHEAFPVFDSDACRGCNRTSRASNSSDGKSSTASSYGKRLLCCSLSTDSGIEDGCRRSTVISTSEHSSCISSATSESASESDISSSRSSEISSLSQLEEDLDVFELEQDDANVETNCCWPSSKLSSVQKDGPPGAEVFVDECGSDENDQKEFDNSQKKTSEREFDVDSQISPKDDAVTSSSTQQRQPLQTLSIRARRKVTFSNDLHVNSSSTSSSTDSASSSTDATTASSSSSTSSFSWQQAPRFRPVYSRQDSTDSNTSTSSAESVLAVPFSPASPTSPTEDTFVFPGKHRFSEPREGCDLMLLAEGQRFYVHHSVVAWQCHVLLLHVRETGSMEVVLPDRRADDVLTFLQLLYPFCKQTITDRNVEVLLDLAQSMGCDRVLRMCTTFLVGLAQFPHLCPHRHLIGSTRLPPHHAPNLSGCRQNSGVVQDQGTNERVNPRHIFENALESSEKENLDPTGNFDGNKNTSQQSPFNPSCLCACADTMVSRVLEFLQLAVKYDLDDVYHTYLDVAARVRAEDVRMCPSYIHLSPATREDVLTSRVRRLENLVGNISITSSDLIGCGRSRHEDFRVAFNGELCLRCMSRNLLRQAKDSV